MTIRRYASAALLVALVTVRANAEAPLEGSWDGRWVREQSAVKVSMTFTRKGDAYSGSFDSEQLRVIGIPLQKISYRPPPVRWEVVGDETTTTFEAEIRDGEMRGRFREGKAEGTFALTRSKDPAAKPREEAISFSNGAVKLGGTVVLPAGAGPFPGIVFLHGSGPEGRWANRFLASRFAERGIAALIYDKRGVGESTGSWQEAGFDDLVQDAAAAVAALRARPEVDQARVGFHGHSQGGTIAPYAARAIKEVAFVVASSAVGVPADECEVFSLENSLSVRSMSPGDAKLAREFVRALVATAYRGAPRAELDAAAEEIVGKPWAFRPPPEKSSYWSLSRRIADYDPLVHWRQVSAPTLLVYGGADERVPARRSAARIAEAYLSARGSRLETRIFEGADHTFRLPSEKPGHFAWPRTAPGYPEAVVDWVGRVTAGYDRR